MEVTYRTQNVLDASIDRIRMVFDEFDNIVVSVSSGKDSIVLYHIALKEAMKRNRKITVFFLDQEAEYQSSIDLIEKMMVHPNVIPMWYQIPVYLTNATSSKDYFLYAWGEGEKWIRSKNELSIESLDVEYPKRFYDFFEWMESRFDMKTAMLVGLRSKESLNRFRAVTTNPGYNNILWSTKTTNEKVFRFYPIYDWCFNDIWKYINDNKIEYNKIYDKMFLKNGDNISSMRVSNLIHEKSFKCLADLQEYEPDTYNKLIERINGIHCAALYAKESYIFNSDILPKRFVTWEAYRNYLLETTPMKFKERIIKRFNKQDKSEQIFQQQCKQLLINDWENNVPVEQNKGIKEKMEKWKKIL